MEDSKASQFSLQPLAAAEPGDLRTPGINASRTHICLFAGCEFKSADAFILDHHQQQNHVGGPSLSETIPLRSSGVPSHRIVIANSIDPSFDSGLFVNGAGPSAGPPACYTTLNAEGMTISQPGYYGYTTPPHDGLRLGYPSEPGFTFAERDHAVQSTTSPQSHFTQHSQMGTTVAPQPPILQYASNQVQAPIQHNAHPVHASRRYRCQHPGCNTTVSRYSDLNRHMRTHQAGVRGFDCPDNGCNRKGVKGFARKDKMLDHYHAVHQ
ncbi:MAG: hypothetical protein Q9195_009442 [Heterodermia aff. obscurata]